MKKERWSYSCEEIALLRELCSSKIPLSWKEIATRFPGRSIHGLRDKAKHLGFTRSNGQVGRPRKLVTNLDAVVDRDDDAWASKAEVASVRLGVAIDAMLARTGLRLAA